MADRFIIHKATRYSGAMVREIDAYTGPTCDAAQVTAGQVYASRAAAKSDAIALSTWNDVGFFILEVGKQGREAIRDFYVNGTKRSIRWGN